MNIRIETGIPVPASKAPAGSLTEAIKKLKPGDSFLYDKPSSVITTARRVGVKVLIRKKGDKVRVWRRPE